MTSGPPISAFSFLKTQRFHAAVPLAVAPCGATVSAWWFKPQEPWIIYPGGNEYCMDLEHPMIGYSSKITYKCLMFIDVPHHSGFS